MKGEDLFKRQRRADSGAYASEKQKHQMLKDFVNLITTQAATFTSSDSYLFFAQFCIFLYMFSPLKSFISCNLSRFLMQILYLLLVFVFLSLCSYGSQVLSNIRAAVPSTVHKNPKTFASSRETRTGHVQKDEKHGTRLKCNPGVVIEKRPNDNGKLKEAAVTKMSSSGKQLSNKPLALHDTPNHMALVDYVADIYEFYKDYERFDRPLDYIQHQMGITEDLRATVVDWIIAVHNKFALRPEALYLAIYIIDQYLSLERLHGRELKLVGISALYISSKYDDMRAPQVLDFIDITDGAYSREEVLAMEKIILKSLHWKLTIPTQYMFLVQFLQTSKCDKEMERMVFFLAELGLMKYSTVKFSPSVAAASAVYAARWTLRKSPHWTETLKHHTGLSEIQLMDCAQILVKSLFDAPRSNLKVVYNKYSIEQF